MSHIGKKRRVSSSTSDYNTRLHSNIVAAFRPRLTPVPKLQVATFSSLFSADSLSLTQLAAVCDGLSCVSTESGRSALAMLQHELAERVYSPSEVASVIFAHADADADADSIPHLCVLTSLLTSKVLRSADLPHHVVVQRAAMEMQEENQCSCRGVRSGVFSILQYCLGESRIGGDDFLDKFGCEVFQDASVIRGGINVVQRLKLAEVTVRFIKERAEDHEAMHERLAGWLRLAVLPTAAVQEATTGDVSWTTELSGLAVGRNPAEYLTHRTTEAKALATLCSAVPLSKAGDVFAECLRILISSSAKEHVSAERSFGAWAKVVILLQRIVNNENHADVEPSHHRSVISPITAAFSSTRAITDAHATAVLVCLARRCFLPDGSSTSESSVTTRHANHEKWFRDLIANNEGIIVKGLIRVLEDLLPLEPLRFLRTNHRVLSANKKYFALCKDYLVSARARISELDPLHGNGTLRNKAEDTRDGESVRRAQEVVTNFVLEFVKTEGKLPASLVRQMNFHRYHFRAVTLPALLDPNLEPGRDGSIDANVDRDEFDENRIKLIKVLAFKRKDQAVTSAEAQTAIKAISEEVSMRAAQRARQNHVRPESSSKQSEEDGKNNLSHIVEKSLFHALKTCRDSSRRDAEDDRRFSSSSVISLIGEAIQKDQTERGLAQAANEILEGFLNGIIVADCGSIFVQSTKSSEGLFSKCQEWWNKDGFGLTEFCREVLVHNEVSSLRKPLQFQLLALFCYGGSAMTRTSQAAAAIFVSILCLLAEVPAISDLCFAADAETPEKQLFLPCAIMDSMSLAEPFKVRSSSFLALYCFCLLKSVPKECSGYKYILSANTISHEPTPSVNDSGANSLSMFISQTENMLRWILSQPWRLVFSNGKHIDPSDEVTASIEAKELLQVASLALSMKRPLHGKHWPLKQWLHCDYKCGWGQAKDVARVLRCFHQRGMSSIEILGEVSMFLATRPFSLAEKHYWIAEGLVQFTDEILEAPEISCEDRNTKSLASYLRICRKEHGAESAFRMLCSLSTMDERYFSFLNFPEADQHLSDFLIPNFWPFSSSCLKYLLQSLGNMPNSSDDDVSTCRSRVFLISNIVLKWNTMEEFTSRIGANIFALGSLARKAAEAHHAVRQLTEFEDSRHDRITQMPLSAKPPLAIFAEEDAELLGLSLVLLLVSSRNATIREKTIKDVLKTAIRQLLQNSPERVVGEAIDAATCAATFCPFTWKFCEEYESEFVMQSTNDILDVLILERLQLFGSSCPLWAWVKLTDSPQAAQGFTNLTNNWLGNITADHDDDGSMSSNLAIAVCTSRIFETFLRIPKNELARVVINEHSQAASVIVHNIMAVHKILSESNANLSSEKLCPTAMQRLLSCKQLVLPQLLDVVGLVVKLLNTCGERNAYVFMDKILLDFPEQANEVRTFLRARDIIDI